MPGNFSRYIFSNRQYPKLLGLELAIDPPPPPGGILYTMIF